MPNEKSKLQNLSGVEQLDRVGPYLVITNRKLHAKGESNRFTLIDEAKLWVHSIHGSRNAAKVFAQKHGQGAHNVTDTQGHLISNPPIARLLFEDTRFAAIWLVARVLLGWVWLNSGIGKLSSPGWMETGAALKGFLANAVAVSPTGKTPIAFDWYRGFIQGLLDSGSYVWFAKLVAISETLVGIALIIGLFVGIAAFAGGLMNWSFVMAGTASTNGLLFAVAILLVLAWKTAGYYGLDRFVLPRLGTPWRASRVDTPPATRRRPAVV